jgi:hypothetical protein
MVKTRVGDEVAGHRGGPIAAVERPIRIAEMTAFRTKRAVRGDADAELNTYLITGRAALQGIAGAKSCGCQ